MIRLSRRPDGAAGDPVPALRSLGDTDLALVRTAAAGLPGAWSVAAERDYDGDLSLVLIPDGDDAVAPTFLLGRDAAGIQLGACRWDSFTRLGCFPNVAAALARIGESLAN